MGERVQAGERVTLTCTVSLGDEPLSITWLWHGTPIGSGTTNPGGMSVVNLNSYNSVLSIELVGPQHAGDFTCVATNAAAATRYTYTLTVHGTAPIPNFHHPFLTLLFCLPLLQFPLALNLFRSKRVCRKACELV